jgi:hypothetical protein
VAIVFLKHEYVKDIRNMLINNPSSFSVFFLNLTLLLLHSFLQQQFQFEKTRLNVSAEHSNR